MTDAHVLWWKNTIDPNQSTEGSINWAVSPLRNDWLWLVKCQNFANISPVLHCYLDAVEKGGIVDVLGSTPQLKKKRPELLNNLLILDHLMCDGFFGRDAHSTNWTP